MTDLARLKALCPPPPGHVPHSVNWHQTEQGLGRRLPDDYKQIVETYGAGKFTDFLGIYQPNCPYIALDLARQTSDVRAQLVRHQEISGTPLPHLPDELQPAGITDNGDYLLWLMNSPDEPASWTLTATSLKDDEWYDFEGNLTAFLVALARHEIAPPVFPDSLLRRMPSFTPHTAHPEEVEKANRANITPAAGPVQSEDIRRWARSNGHDVPDHGRIPAAIRKAYNEAHPSP
jgi:hypothetical protein